MDNLNFESLENCLNGYNKHNSQVLSKIIEILDSHELLSEETILDKIERQLKKDSAHDDLVHQVSSSLSGCLAEFDCRMGNSQKKGKS